MVSQFWSDLEGDLADPEFARDYAADTIRIRTIDALVNQLDQGRAAAGLSKAALARAIGADPSVVRRLLSATSVNPTLGTIAEVAAALGLRVTLTPLSDQEREEITLPMISTAAA